MQGADPVDDPKRQFWGGGGVTVSGVAGVRRALDKAGGKNVTIMLSSGFGIPEKVNAFIRAEREFHSRLFDSLGIGELFPSRIATMDIVGVGDTPDTIIPVAKTGRAYKPNGRLRRIL
jgi:nicotinate phosphoribosyltransferase